MRRLVRWHEKNGLPIGPDEIRPVSDLSDSELKTELLQIMAENDQLLDLADKKTWSGSPHLSPA